MNLAEFIFIQPVFQLFTLYVTSLSSWYLIRSVIELSPREAARISQSPKNFAQQKADTVLGFILLMFSLVIQVWNVGQPLRFIDVDGLTLLHYLITAPIFVLGYYTAEKARIRLIRKYSQDFAGES